MIESIIQSYGAIGIFFTLLLEIGAFLFPLPGDSLVFTAGILIEAGMLDFYTTFLAVFMGSICAGHLGYFIGQKMGIERIQKNRFFSVDETHINRSKKFFEKHGALAIIASRFIPVVRTFISPFLGTIGYNKYKFLSYNLLASLLWTTIVLWLGMTVGKFFPNFIKYTEYIILSAVLLFLIPLVYEILKRKKK